MLWSDKIKKWKSGEYQIYPKNIKSKFFYETFVCDKNMTNEYHEKFLINNNLEKLTQDYSSFDSYIKSSKNKYVTSFQNLGGDSILIIPIPRKSKNFTTIKDFIDNASITQQIKFWKYAGSIIETILQTNDKIYISTHGLGVPYFHLRLDKHPKYYQTKKFI